jgi:hypothetical protein
VNMVMSTFVKGGGNSCPANKLSTSEENLCRKLLVNISIGLVLLHCVLVEVKYRW